MARPADTRLFFFHGLESGPEGSKFHALSEITQVHSPDFRGMDAWQRLEKAARLTEGKHDLVVAGSSYGGLVASLLYDRHPERFRGLVLLAPALHLEEASYIRRMPPPEQTVVLHGRHDDVVPLEQVQAFCARFGLTVEVVDDGHRLQASYDRMRQAVRRLMA